MYVCVRVCVCVCRWCVVVLLSEGRGGAAWRGAGRGVAGGGGGWRGVVGGGCLLSPALWAASVLLWVACFGVLLVGWCCCHFRV